MAVRRSIFIRADGNGEIGLGHLVRCLALAYILKDDYDITFFCSTIPKNLAEELKENGFNVFYVKNEDEFLNCVKDSNVVILDGYRFTTDFQKKIKATGACLVCIDDLHDKEFVADLIISHSPGIKPDDYKAQSYTKFALGLKYALLRPAFLDQSSKHRIIERLESIFICFGGADPLNITAKTLHIITQINYFRKIIVVTGSEYKLTKIFNNLILNDQRIVHLHSLSEDQILAAMIESDIAVVPASGILLEICSVGMPVITGYYVLDQKKVARNFYKDNLALCLGNFQSDYSSTLTELLESVNLEKANQLVTNQRRIFKDSKNQILNLFKSLE